MNQDVILETIKSSFLFNFRTGIVIVDTMITGLVIMVTTHLLNLVTSNSSRLVQIWQQWLRRGSSRAKITITSRAGTAPISCTLSTLWLCSPGLRI